jgi:hypothetical protein
MNIAAEHYRVPNACKPFEPESLGLAENFCAQPQDIPENGGAPVDIFMSTKLMVATEPDWIRSAIEKHRKWIESVQGVPIERMAVLQVSNSFTSLAARQILRGVPLNKLHNGPTAKLQAAVTSIEYPKGMPPLIRADLHSKASAGSGDRQNRWNISWGDTPVAVRFKQLQGAIIALEMPHHEHDATCWSEIVICRQDEIALAMEMIRESNVSEDGALYSTGRSFKRVKSSSWDDLVLDEPVLQLVKSDYESFFAREDWFRSLKLPFRRGYLLHGPPGNGKTSVIRAMLSRRGMRGLTLNFFSPNTDDDDLQKMFERAADCAPSMVVLEDIDRAFPRDQASGTKSKVSLQQLLNCLDGIGTQDGVVVVATANEPTALDPAILRRPGRFDRVVLFPNPTAELRLRYLRKLNCQFAEAALKQAIDSSDGFSFAQMREVYILAGQRAFNRQAEIEPGDIISSVQTLRHGFAEVKERQSAAGFAPSLNVIPIDCCADEEPIPF